MTVDFQLNQDDLVAIGELQQQQLAAKSKLPSRVYYFGVLPCLLAGVALVAESFLVGCLFGLLFIAATWVVQNWTARLQARVIFSDADLSLQTLPQQVTLSEEGVRFASKAGHYQFRWSYIQEVIPRGPYVSFRLTPSWLINVPKRAFRDDTQVSEFLKLAESFRKGATASSPS